MPWAGGTYTKGNNATGGWAGDASLGIGIEAGRHDTQDNDFATGINNCLTKDGTNSATADLNLGGYKPVNIASGTAAAPAICAGNDTNTGMFSKSADTIGWATNGVERMNLSSTGQFTLRTADAIGTILQIENWNSTGQVPVCQMIKSRGGALDVNTIVQNGDVLGTIRFYGANGTGFNQAAVIQAAVDGTPGATNDMPGRLEFYTTADGAGSPTERMRITNAGNVGIGITNPTHPLEVVGNTSSPSGPALKLRGRPTNEAAKITFTNNADTTEHAVITGSSAELYVYHGTKLNLDAPIYLPGLTSGAGTHFVKWSSTSKILTYDTSSLRYKENVADIPYGLNCIKLLSPKVFTYKTTGDKDIGFIAEEMREVVPEIVSLDAEGKPDAISYDRLTAVLCKAIQELTTKVEALEALQAA